MLSLSGPTLYRVLMSVSPPSSTDLEASSYGRKNVGTELNSSCVAAPMALRTLSTEGVS